MEFYLVGVKVDQIPLVWSNILPLVNAALNYSDLRENAEDVLESLLSSQRQLYMIIRNENHSLMGMLITEIVQYPRSKRCTLVLLSGVELSSWLFLLTPIVDWAAKEHGCDTIEVYGRPGWEKLLKPYGFSKSFTVFTKHLSDGESYVRRKQEPISNTDSTTS